MDIERSLRIAEWLCGPDIRRDVVEPLLADAQRQVAAAPSRLNRLRWRFAVAQTLLLCAPRATVSKLSTSFVIDVLVRALAFGALTFALQWTFGDRLRSRTATVVFPPSFATTFLFFIMPVVLRIRTEGIPIHQQRLLTCTFAACCVVSAWITLVPGIALGAALLAATAWTVFGSWRFYDYAMGHTPMEAHWGMMFFFPASTVLLANFPINLAVGNGLLQPWWGGSSLIAYLLAGAILFTSGLPFPEAPYRKLLK